MAAEQQGSGNRTGSGDGNGASFGFGQATDAVDKLRSVLDQAVGSIRELTKVSEQWAQVAQERAADVAKELRSQGEQAMSNVSDQVEHNPLTSLAVAFAVGYLVATMTRR